MSKRTVFGRLRFDQGGVNFKIEMRDEDALYIRERNRRSVWRIPFFYLLRFCHNQFELFNEGQQETHVPNMPVGPLVPTLREMGIVHESPQQPAQDAQVGGDGLAALIGRAEAQAARAGLSTPPDTSKLPSIDGGLAGGNDAGGISGAVDPPGSPPLDVA